MWAVMRQLCSQVPRLSAGTIFKGWYTLFFASQVCLLPYIVLHFQRSGLTPKEIGLLLALQPWISAPAGFIWSWLADRTHLHKFLLLVNLPTSIFLRASIVLSDCKTCFVLLVLMTEITSAPVTALVDVAAVSSCDQDSDYGKLRLWGGVGWGVFSVIAGWIIERHGLTAALVPYFILGVPCVLLTACMNTWTPRATGLTQQASEQTFQETTKNPSSSSNAAIDVQLAHCPATTSDGSEDAMLQDQSIRPTEPCSIHARKHTPAATGQATHHLKDKAVADKATHSQDQAGRCSLETSSVQHYVHEGHSVAQYPHEACMPSRASVVGAAAGKKERRSSESEWFEGARGDQMRIAGKDMEAGEMQQARSCTEAGRQMSGVQGLLRLLSDPQVLCFLFLGTLMGYGLGQMGSFFFLLLEELQGSKTLMGTTLAVTCMSEIPVFQLQSFMLQHISLNALLHIVALSYVVRLLCYGLLPWWGTPWAVLPVELLHGLTFACAWGLGTVQARRLAHPGLETTMQGLFQGVFFGVGAGLGALVGGLLSNRYGYQAMYLIGAATMLVGYLVYAAVQQGVNACTGKHQATALYSPVASDERNQL